MLLYLLPPSEWKTSWWQTQPEQLSFVFSKPTNIIEQVTQRDLKCSGKRYEEAIQMNRNIMNSLTLPAISRYSWVMFTAIWYQTMLMSTQEYFAIHTCILSGMYGVLKPQDSIWNYKLPIETRWLYTFWKEQNITNTLIDLAETSKLTYIDLLPNSYKKMIDRKRLDEIWVKYMPVNFYENNKGELKKLTHTVKKVKWNWLREICEKQISCVEQLWGIQLEDEIQIIV